MPIKRRQWLEQLKSSGCRITKARRTIIEVLESTVRALTPLEVFDIAKKKDPYIGLVTVYRTIEKLDELGLIQRVHQVQGCQAYIRAGQGHQHLLLCERCGRTVLFDGEDLSSLFSYISKQTGFDIKEHWMQVLGVCSDCK